MYPCHYDVKSAETSEITAFWADCEALGAVCDVNNWHVTTEWADKFAQHLRSLFPLAEGGNALAQYYVAAIYMLGYCYTSAEEQAENYQRDMLEMSKWLERAARQGIVAAVDNLVTMGVGPEAERVRVISREVLELRKAGHLLPIGETWNRAYVVAVPERKDGS